MTRLTSDKNSEKFFKVFYDRMRDAQAEIKATVSVNTTDTLNNKSQDKADEVAKPEVKKTRKMHKDYDKNHMDIHFKGTLSQKKM